MESEVELDDAQRRVAEAPVDKRLLVVAGAGQGKTEVVSARLGHLIEEEGLSASSELLVLSFSRAAVHSVRTRLSERDIAELNVRTFDSFASQVLIDADEEPQAGFEARIRQATGVLAEHAAGTEWIDDLCHVVIDEVQDVVGDRAALVLALLERLDEHAGFTVLGDPLQGIYDFARTESADQTTSAEFLARVAGDFGATEVALSKNHRAQGQDCVRIAQLGQELRRTDDATEALSVLRAVRESLPQISRVDRWEFLGDYSGRSAVLCRTNAEVLRISRQLVDAGVRHAVRRPAQAFGASKWIGRALGPLVGPAAARSEVETRLAQILGAEAYEAWYLLKAVDVRSRSTEQIDLGRVRRAVAAANVPLALTQDDVVGVVVSTIHRAKGLEFDNVFLADWRDSFAGEREEWEQVRLEYVALTRASQSIVRIETPRSRSVISESGWLPGRHQERAGTKGRLRARAMEIGYDDGYVSRPVAVGEQSASSIQENLDRAIPGTAVNAVLDITRSDQLRPIYALTVGGSPIGVTTEDFGREFAALFRVRPGQWPSELTDMVLVSVETTAGDPRIAEEAGVGPGGFWLVPRVAGLARPLWDVMEKVG